MARTNKTTKTGKANRKNGEGSLAWLMTPSRRGELRLRTLSWGRLARIYYAKKTDPAVRRAICREARKCGYEPLTILSLNRWS